METRANYVLIGAFTLAGLLGAFGFLLWIAKVDVERQYAYYDILFESVEGLSAAASVRFNGLPVGSVVDMNLDEQDASKVRVRVEIDADTPITTNTIAVLNSQGVTGVSYVSLSKTEPGGTPIPSGGDIESRPSTLQTIFEGAPKLLNEAVDLLGDLKEVVDEDNRDAITSLLSNLSSASGRLDSVLSDFETLSGDLGKAATAIAGFTDQLDTLSATAETTLTTATETLKTAGTAAETAVGTLDSAKATFETADQLIKDDISEFVQRGTSIATTLDSTINALDPTARATVEAAKQLVETQVPQVLSDLQDAITTIEHQVALVGSDASTLISRYDQVGKTVQERAQQTEKAIAKFEVAVESATKTLDSVRQTSDSANAFIIDQARPLAQRADTALASVEDLTTNHIPPLLDQATQVVTTFDTEAKALSKQAQEVLSVAQSRLTEARSTLDLLDTTLTSATTAADSVTKTSDEIYDLTTQDGAALVKEARAAVASANAAITTINSSVQQDLPGILQEIRSATASANQVIGQLGDNLNTVTGKVSTLADEGTQTLAAATVTFTEAVKTLEAIEKAMDTADSTLSSAETTFTSVNRILDDDVDSMIADIRRAVTSFSSTVETVSTEVTAISAEVLSASKSAADLMGTVDSVVQSNERQLSDLLRIGLPQFQQFIAESRRLVVNLERLVDRVEKDPARFILGTQAPEFRR